MLISVIIPTYNRSESLKDVLDSLIHQESTDGFDWEVLIVDNNSKDKTKELAEEFIPKFKGKLRYIFEPTQGINCARNVGINNASGDILSFVEDDCVVNKDWLFEITEFFKNPDHNAMGGKILPLLPPDTPNWIRRNQASLNGPILQLHDFGPVTRTYQERGEFFIGANMHFRKSIFNECGMFRVDLGSGTGSKGSETEFFERLRSHNLDIYYSGRVALLHKSEAERMNLRFLARWYVHLGRFAARKNFGEKKEGSVRYFGIPRYLFKDIICYFFLTMFSFLNEQKFLKHFGSFFENIGMFGEYYRFANKEEKCRR